MLTCLLNKIVLVMFFSDDGPVLYPAKKYPDGLFYAEVPSTGVLDSRKKRNVQLEIIEVPDFLSDETLNSDNEQCVGVFSDIIDPDSLSLQTIDCNVKSLIFFEQDSYAYTSDSGLPTLPCVSSSKRRKRSTDGDQG